MNTAGLDIPPEDTARLWRSGASLAVAAFAVVAAGACVPCYAAGDQVALAGEGEGEGDVVGLSEGFPGSFKAEPGGVWVDGSAATEAGCDDGWAREPNGQDEIGVVEKLRPLPHGGALFRVPVDAEPGDVLRHDIVCNGGLEKTIGVDHRVVGATPDRAVPVLRSAEPSANPPVIVRGCSSVYPLPLGAENDTEIDSVDVAVDVDTDATELRLDAWLLAPGAPLPAEAARRVAVMNPLPVDAGHATLFVAGRGSYDLKLRVTDLQRGQTSDVLTVPLVIGGCAEASSSAPALAALGLALLAAMRRRRR